MYDSIVIGCGFAGATAARELAEKKGHKVLVIDKRSHVGGNCYDSMALIFSIPTARKCMTICHALQSGMITGMR